MKLGGGMFLDLRLSANVGKSLQKIEGRGQRAEDRGKWAMGNGERAVEYPMLFTIKHKYYVFLPFFKI